MQKLMNEEIELIRNEEEITRFEKEPEQNNKSIVKGLFVRVPNGYEVVAEGLKGKLKTKKEGLRFFYPWDKKYLIYTQNTPIDFKKEKYKSSEGFEISVDAAVTYHVVNSEKFYIQKNGLKQLKLIVGEILRTYASEHNFDEVNSWSMDINLEVIKNQLKDLNGTPLKVDNVEIISKLLPLYEQYGISVSNIIVQKAELSDELKKSKEEDSLTDAKNKRMLATANAELEAAKIKADAEKTKGEAEATIIEQKIKYISQQIGGANTTEQLQLIKAILLGENAKYTVIENGTGDSTYSKMAYFNQNDENAIEKGISKIKK